MTNIVRIRPIQTMASLSRQDFETILDCVERLHECEGLEQFPAAALRQLQRLVGVDHISFNYVAPAVPRVTVVGSPAVTNHSQKEAVFARYLPEHPVLRHYLATGDGSAHKISDFLAPREYHALSLYDRLFHELQYEDQFAILLFPPGSEMIAFALSRRRRNFSERDREVLNRLRPHVAQAYRQTEHLGLLTRALREPRERPAESRVTTILLNAQGKPVHFGPHAGQWLREFFPHHAPDSLRLPQSVTEWLERNRAADPSIRTFNSQFAFLQKSNDRHRLRLRIYPGLLDRQRTLVLERETLPAAAASALGGILTPREIEVLRQVEQGKTNIETGAALGISPLTVRAHLEHIFEKLRVPSRTAAVTEFRRRINRSGE